MRTGRWLRGGLWMLVGCGAIGAAAVPFAQEPRGPRPEAAAPAPEKGETLRGKIKEMLRNDKGDVHGMRLDDGTEVRFPPHFGGQVGAAVKAGDAADFTGRKERKPKGEEVFEVVRVQVGERILVLQGPPPGKGRPAGPHGPKGPHAAPEEAMQAAGKIVKFAVNPRGDTDGFKLENGTEVKFPPHRSKQLTEIVQAGDEVKVEGRKHLTPKGEIHLHADKITAVASGKTLERDEPHGPPDGPRARRAGGRHDEEKPGPGKHEEAMRAAGKIAKFAVNPGGETDGFVLENGIEVKLPPPHAKRLVDMAKVGEEVRVEGRKHVGPKGETHLHAMKITAVASGNTLERDEPHGPPHGPRQEGHGPQHGPRHEPHGPRGPHADSAATSAEILQELRAIRKLLEDKAGK